jgi:hypothetical protein
LFLRCGHFSFSFHYILCIFQDIVEHWLITENVDGFYIRNSAYMYEDYDMRNETKANIPGTNEVFYLYTPFARCSILSFLHCVCIGECPSNSPFLKNNGVEAPKGPRPIVFKECRDTRSFSNLKSTHCTLIILLIINLVTKKSLCIQKCSI